MQEDMRPEGTIRPIHLWQDKQAAWHLYVEIETRIITQPLHPEHCDEKTALDSVYSLFQTTREVLIARGPDCTKVGKLAIEVLNEKVRPFTAKWHRESLKGAFNNPAACQHFRRELAVLQESLRAFSHKLIHIVQEEDNS